MKNTFNYFASRFLIIISFILLIGFIYQNWFYSETLKSEGWLKKIGETSFSKKADILYFSASPNASYPTTDKDRRSIHEKIQAKLKNLNIEALDTGAIHAGIFLHALKQLPEDYHPKIVLMDLNLRSFGKMWIHSGLENSLQRNLAFWNDFPGLYNRIMASLKSYNYIPLDEREALISFGQKFDVLPFKDSCKTIKRWVDSLNHRMDHSDNIGQEFVRNFAFQIEKKNEMLKYYDEIVKLCRIKNIKLIFLVLPENIETMNLKSGKELENLCLRNITFLKNHFRRTPIIDLSFELNSSYFYEVFPTEHYNQDGREYIANKVAGFIQKNLKKLEKYNENKRSSRNRR